MADLEKNKEGGWVAEFGWSQLAGRRRLNLNCHYENQEMRGGGLATRTSESKAQCNFPTRDHQNKFNLILI